jgi:hypothetical protein
MTQKGMDASIIQEIELCKWPTLIEGVDTNSSIKICWSTTAQCHLILSILLLHHPSLLHQSPAGIASRGNMRRTMSRQQKDA